MSKVLQMIDYEHLMDYEQYVRIELMIEKDKASECYDQFMKGKESLKTFFNNRGNNE